MVAKVIHGNSEADGLPEIELMEAKYTLYCASYSAVGRWNFHLLLYWTTVFFHILKYSMGKDWSGECRPSICWYWVRSKMLILDHKTQTSARGIFVFSHVTQGQVTMKWRTGERQNRWQYQWQEQRDQEWMKYLRES